MRSIRFAAAASLTPLLAAPLHAQFTTRVSVDSTGSQADSDSATAALSRDGRFVAFTSAADDLVPGDTNGVLDVFVHDRWTGVTERASVSSSGAQADADCLGPYLSADGRFVAFRSDATTLVPGDANGVADVFVHDRATGATVRASVDAAGGDANAWSYYGTLSGDGRYVCFQSEADDLVPGDANQTFDVFVRDLLLGTTERASLGPAGEESGPFEFSGEPSLSLDGRYVAFASAATGFAPGDGNGAPDVFVRDRVAGTTVLVSVALGGGTGNGGSELPCISGDGLTVVFVSEASDLVPGDTNGAADVFVRDLQSGLTERVSVSSSGEEANDDCYLYYSHPTISDDGRRVVFESYASNLVPNDGNGWSDVFVRDRAAGVTRIASLRPDGAGIHQGAGRGTISGDGALVAFESRDDHLVAGDANGAADVFLHVLRAPCTTPRAFCVAKPASTGCIAAIATSGLPTLSGPDAFFVTVSGARSHQFGFLVWGLAESQRPFGGGTLCVAPPLARSPQRDAEGTPAVDDCSGALWFRFDAQRFAATGASAGTSLFGQYLMRDPGYPAPEDWALSDAIRFELCP